MPYAEYSQTFNSVLAREIRMPCTDSKEANGGKAFRSCLKLWPANVISSKALISSTAGAGYRGQAFHRPLAGDGAGAVGGGVLQLRHVWEGPEAAELEVQRREDREEKADL